MFSATVHIQYVSVTCQNLFSNKYKTVHLQRSGARERARVGARACADVKARLFSSGSPVGFSQTVRAQPFSVHGWCQIWIAASLFPSCGSSWSLLLSQSFIVAPIMKSSLRTVQAGFSTAATFARAHTQKHQDKHTDSRGTERNKHLSTHSSLFGLARCSDTSVFPPQHIDEVFLWDRTKDLCPLPVWSTSILHLFLHSFLVFPDSVEQLNHPSEWRRTTLEQMLGCIYVKQRHKANGVVTL